MHWEILQIAERTVARAEVVEGDLHPEFLERVEGLVHVG